MNKIKHEKEVELIVSTIKRWIDSCITPEQLEICMRAIHELFDKKFYKDFKVESDKLHEYLFIRLDELTTVKQFFKH